MKIRKKRKTRVYSYIARFVCAALCLILLLPSQVSALTAPDLTAAGEKALVYSVDYSRVLWSNAPDEKIAPASFTKIMTAALAFEFIADNPGVLVTVSDYAATRSTGTKLGLKTGEILPMEELLSAMALTGANDAAIAIAETVAGSEAEFVSRMNKKADQLGMHDTYFANPTGIDNSAMYTTLSDVAKLCSYAYRFNSYMVLATEPSHTIPETALSKERKIDNANKLVVPSRYSGYYTESALGFCAGGTQNSGLCVATSFRIGSLSYVVIITGGKYENEKYSTFTDARTLINFTSASYSLFSVVLRDQVVGQMNVRLAKNSDVVALVASDTVQTLLPNDYNSSLIRIECEYFEEYKQGLTAPIDGGLTVGELTVKYGATLLGRTPIVTQRALELSFWDSLWNRITLFFSKGWVQTTLKILAGALILATLIILTISFFRHRKKTVGERKAVRKYLDDERRRFENDKELYRKRTKKRIRIIKAKLKEIKANRERKREMINKQMMDDAMREENLRREKLKQRAQSEAEQKESLAPDKATQDRTPQKRRGDEYYRK